MIFSDVLNCGIDDDCDPAPLGSCTDVMGTFLCACNSGFRGVGTRGTCISK